jgi:hypothetical protein
VKRSGREIHAILCRSETTRSKSPASASTTKSDRCYVTPPTRESARQGLARLSSSVFRTAA